MSLGKVLIIDDEVSICKTLSKILVAYDYEVYYKLLGRLGYEILQQEGNFDVVVTDIYLPDIDGLTLLEKLKKLDNILPVVLITAQPSDETIALALKRGAFDFVIKPFETTNILNVIKRAVEFRRRGFMRQNNF